MKRIRGAVIERFATGVQASSGENGAAVSPPCSLLLVALRPRQGLPTKFDLDPAMIELAESCAGVTVTSFYPADHPRIEDQTRHPPAATEHCSLGRLLRYP